MLALLSLLLATNPTWADPVAPPALPYDCFGDICLNSKAPAQVPLKIVRVADMDWERKVQVCSGVVTAITISTYWLSPLTWAAIPEAQRVSPFEQDSADNQISKLIAVNLGLHVAAEGWVETETKTLTNPPGVSMTLANAKVNGVRGLLYVKVKDNLGYVIMMISNHPDQGRLCGPTGR